MRKLIAPAINDSAILTELSSSKANSATVIRSQLALVSSRYEHYRASRGNPKLVQKDDALAAFKDHFIELYETPPVALSFIEDLRASITGACPVCGRDALGTLDHYLPKADFSEFSFFSKNLIPACNRCNNSRSNLVQGAGDSDRPVHPYYDEFLVNRVITVDIQPDWRAPIINVIPFGLTNDALATMEWHIANVIHPSGFKEYAEGIWGQITSQPVEFFQGKTTIKALKGVLAQLCQIETIVSGTANSWRSALFHGIGNNSEALKYLKSLITKQMHSRKPFEIED